MVTQLQPDVRAYLHGGEVIKNELEYVDESQKPDTTESANASNGSTGGAIRI